MVKEVGFFLLVIIGLGLVFAVPGIHGQDAKAQGTAKLDIYYTNNVEGYLEPCG